MQKTFNVWVKRSHGLSFTVCSKRAEVYHSKTLMNVNADDAMVDSGSDIQGCDVSQWLETLEIEVGEVRSFELTFKEN